MIKSWQRDQWEKLKKQHLKNYDGCVKICLGAACSLYFQKKENTFECWCIGPYDNALQCVLVPFSNKCLYLCLIKQKRHSNETKGLVPKLNKTVFSLFLFSKNKIAFQIKLMAWCLQCPPKIKLFFLSMLFILQNKTTFQIGPMVRCSQSPRQNKTDDGRTTLVLSVGRPRTTAKILQHDPRAAIRRRFHIFYYFESLF